MNSPAPIDLRSDTVTRPTAAMRAAMAGAEVGDDVYGEDPTVNRLEAEMAERAGMEAALFVASGTQSNLLGIMSHCQRGDEYIVGQQAHTYKFEGGGAAVLGSVQPQPLTFEPDGTLDLAQVEAAIKPDDFHFARTRLLCLENTIGGKVLPLAYQRDARELCRRHGLQLHLDGARVFNAAVADDVPLHEITGAYDSVSVCLSKGLGAPVGSVLCGDRAFIARARRLRKMVGGGMRQAGVLAAACLHALAHHVERLADDHANARALAQRLAPIDGLDVDPAAVQTNMLFLPLGAERARALAAFLRGRPRPVLITPNATVRLVTHLDVDGAAVDDAADAIRAFFRC